MGLYLCIFEDDEDVDGLEVGSYADFGAFRDHIVEELEEGVAGFRFPVLIQHSDCDGEWSPSDCDKLLAELESIAEEMRKKPAVPFTSEWQSKVAKATGLKPQNAYESFIDVDGEFLVARLQSLVKHAVEKRLPIVFQ